MRRLKNYVAISIVLVIIFFFIVVIQTIVSIFAVLNGKNSEIDSSQFQDLPPAITMDILIAAVKSYEKYGVPTAITIAQLIVESGGQSLSELALKDKNLFGVKYFGDGQEGVDYNYWKTNEQKASGEIYTINAKFSKYSSYEDSIDSHSRLLIGHYLPYVTNKESSDSWADGVFKGGYATALNYAESLKSIMKQYNLYRFDGKKTRDLKHISSATFVGGEELGNITDRQRTLVNNALLNPDPYHNGYKGLCEGFVADTFRKAGLHYNGQHCAAYSRVVNANMKGKIPIGAAIYSGDKYRSNIICSCGRDAGHVAIYIGNGKVLGSQVPAIMDLNTFISHFGYGGWYFPSN